MFSVPCYMQAATSPLPPPPPPPPPPHPTSGLRASVWRVLLGLLPAERAQWERVLRRKRAEYAQFCEVREGGRRGRECVNEEAAAAGGGWGGGGMLARVC